MFESTARTDGFTLIEMLVSLAIAALLLTAMTGLVKTALESRADTRMRGDAVQDARFAMQRMVTAVRNTERLLLPLADNPNTTWRENVREQTEPPSPPEGDSTEASAVLAVTLDPTLDIDGDGFADGDNDRDGRVDEDVGNDNTLDGKPGIIAIDDDGDGSVDETTGSATSADNDEDGADNEDPIDGIDEDLDGSVDEEPKKDMNKDGQPGIAGFDDDGDGSIDEGLTDDDDEDGTADEDWFDVHVFFLKGSELLERRPNLNPADGNDYTEYPIAENITRFRVERVAEAGRRVPLIDLTLETTPEDGDPVVLNTRVRVGGQQ